MAICPPNFLSIKSTKTHRSTHTKRLMSLLNESFVPLLLKFRILRKLENFCIHILWYYILSKTIIISYLNLLFHVGIINGILLLPYGYWEGDRNYTNGDDENIAIKTPVIKIGSKVYHGFNVCVCCLLLFIVFLQRLCIKIIE